jgi:carbonic anhydrase
LRHSSRDAIDDENERQDRLEELNVREECINVRKINHVQRSFYATGLPNVHGWVFDLRTGRLIDQMLNMKEESSEIRGTDDLKVSTDPNQH